MKYKATYHLKDPKAEKETPILLYLHWHSERIRMATGMKIHPKLWNKSLYRAKRGAMFETVINRRLDEMTRRAGEIFMEMINAGVIPTPKTMTARLKEGETLSAKPGDVIGYYDQFVKGEEERSKTRTPQVHRTAYNHIAAFVKKGGIRLTFDRLDTTFFERLMEYLTVEVKQNNITALKTLRTFRRFLRWAAEPERGYNKSTHYLSFTESKAKRLLLAGEKSDKIYLTTEELEHIAKLDLSDSERLQRVRDLFLFQCHTGVRYGDLRKLEPSHVRGDTIHLVTGKNRKAVVIPFLPVARGIWEKYGGRLPSISNQKQNDYLKELCERAGFTEPVRMVDFRGNDRIDTVQPKCELIGTHTAKRSFVSILRKRGVSIEALMKVTGNSRKTLEGYILRTDEDAQREVIEKVTG